MAATGRTAAVSAGTNTPSGGAGGPADGAKTGSTSATG
ncbi:hypothetical protein FRUB_02668 [Fimbriiglobus ruber]|uniref:Uncharacterized protein n=1 Tax=Fimbriiglobus ruber TaxID=1908690 RepID=A0A225E0P4_9BACT|nr:hypothetical protein FRUB_02668 [Fimbriiglobus ruber]